LKKVGKMIWLWWSSKKVINSICNRLYNWFFDSKINNEKCAVKMMAHFLYIWYLF